MQSASAVHVHCAPLKNTLCFWGNETRCSNYTVLRLHRFDLGVCVTAKRRQENILLTKTKKAVLFAGPRNELLLLCTALHNAGGVSRCCGCDICMTGVHISGPWCMCGSAKRQRTSPEFEFWGPSRQQAGELHTLSGRKPRKYKPGTTQYHPASVCANPFGRRQNARYTRLDRVTRPLGAASWLPLGRVRLDGPSASESPECAPAPDALADGASATLRPAQC